MPPPTRGRQDGRCKGECQRDTTSAIFDEVDTACIPLHACCCLSVGTVCFTSA